VTARRTNALRLGDRVEYNGTTYVFTALNGDVAELRAGRETPLNILVSALLTDSTFKPVPVEGSRRRGLGESKIFESLPRSVKDRAYRLEADITEILDGSPIAAEPGTRPRREYDITSRSMRQRLLTKEAELREAGEPLSLTTLKRLVRAYESEGIIGLVDQRLIRRTPAAGQVDQRVIDALLAILHQNTDQSSGSMDRLQREVAKRVRDEHGDGVELPSRATFHRLVGKLAQGRHATGSARTRRTLDQQPDGPFGAVHPVRPGELMQIDSTPLDIAVEFEDGITGRVELTALVDAATRSIPAAVLRPTTKAVDAALLLARCVTPEIMRPGWPEAVSMAASALPYRAMRSIDERLENAAAKPVIMPETIVCDHGKAYISNTFKNACRSMGISFQPAHPDTPTDKPIVERTLQSIGTLFAQYVTGYLGSSVERRGKNADHRAVFSLVDLQDLLDEWIITGWQNRPHDGLRDPLTPGRVLSPNEKYAALLSVSGYVPVPLGAENYIQLLPAVTRVINSYGVKIRHRVYDSADLNPYRGQESGIKALKQLWEIRYDPYDVTRVWIRNHHDGGWITAFWRQLHAGPQPFGDTIWEYGRQIVAGRGTDSPSEETIKAAVDDLLTRASGATPKNSVNSRKDRRVVARAKAAEKPAMPAPAPPETQRPENTGIGLQDDPAEDAEELARIIPLKVYDAKKEAQRWW
jgi:putative transposase